MSLDLQVIYRGPLESCNYGCAYCPFAKKKDTRRELAEDARALDRFVVWVGSRGGDRIGVLFTPWGEALVRRAYQEALVRLSLMPHVTRAAIQTNLSSSLAWTSRAESSRLGIWATFHPEWAERARFVGRVRELARRGVRVSVGVVGFLRFADEIEALRREIPAEVYLWINAVKGREPEPYTPRDVARFVAIDPLFEVNTRAHESLGRPCRAGASVVSVDGEGAIRRCHFVRDVIGNLYGEGIESALAERPCPNATCGCHIGYVHMDDLALGPVFGEGLLERIPRAWPERPRLPVLQPRQA